ncbi:FAD/NAD(P)-binding domain-containing protein [Hypomontagnella monticulosa]|nr:FAD/NAD(P)-binding domain-containing protein [Hypomontagnella monticulosa]
MDSDRAPLNVVIVGGSLAGLMCGIALKHAGHHVKIIEQDGSERMSHKSGIGLGPSAALFLQRHDRHSTIFSHRVGCIQTLKNGNPKVLATGNRDITSWDAFYYRLRSNFDGYISPYYPSAPKFSATDGSATYEFRRKVLDISPVGSHMVLSTLNLGTQEISQDEADLVIGADGPDSLVRAKYSPAAKRRYVGYIVWRGIVPEREISEKTRSIFTSSIMTYMMNGHHCVVYTIPGSQGSLEPGERFLNFCWYGNETREDLDEILIDAIDGHRHHHTVPAGHVREDVWSSRLEYGKTVLPAPFLEIALKVQQPFIQVITDFHSPRAAFENGKVLLMGDALTLCRPHTALGSAQAAFHALAIEDYVAGKISVDEWESRVVRFSFLHLTQSVWWGKFYQESIVRALPWAFRYWFYWSVEKIRSWWNKDGDATGVGPYRY